MESSPRRLNEQLPPVAGVKRTASVSLLPAFEPTSSSPSLPRPAKRFALAPPENSDAEARKYPTPVPTSSTNVISSSPPQLPRARPGLQRTQSTLSERAPLSAVPSITLPEDGQPVLMGRSSNSSHYQLSANRLISRVHVTAAFIPSLSPLVPNKVELICMGWNGAKVHCQGRAWELRKGDTFTSETEHDILLDVQDARVLLSWPFLERKGSLSVRSESTWDEESSPKKSVGYNQGLGIASSPLHQGPVLHSPVSPSPMGPGNVQSVMTPPSDAASNDNLVVVYEDEHSDDNVDPSPAPVATQSTLPATQPLVDVPGASQSSELSEPSDFSDRDEENDPIILSFGPQGHNLLPRMASFSTGDSPLQNTRLQPLVESTSPQRRSSSESTREAEATVIANHVINQLAFSRLSSTPLSTILNHLPLELRGESPSNQENKPLTKEELKRVIDNTRSIGEVSREGKDAAGKVLESEYYYIPDMDNDEKRREAVVDGLRKPGLRACRKQHKQYFWRRPKTP
ncbi:MAG: hypothetical protein M1833_000208 [Piccolia ochrophora]|nr:MAG: hypothetical protein M1833_000208 [Piccolia ochrophora]